MTAARPIVLLAATLVITYIAAPLSRPQAAPWAISQAAPRAISQAAPRAISQAAPRAISQAAPRAMSQAASGATTSHAASGATAHAASQNPVLVVGGIRAEQKTLDKMVSALEARGFRASSVQLAGNPSGAAALPKSARVVAGRAAEIRKKTGADRVDVVGHSMGGLALRHYLKSLGGHKHVSTYISVGTPHEGDWLGLLCAATAQGCRDLVPSSKFLKRLNAPPPIPPGVRAFHLFSDQGTGEKNPLPTATNIRIQAFCPGRRVEHASELADAAVQDLVVSILHGGPPATTCPT
ncbi:lipase family alpha/beta hydrolase [Actinomadura sp. 6N118]|uniref:lipase family alpha/beta hydrolase n=1 Tax=Actinomadura sp. 6N118 TaxID=3375151 RepID=UPI0037BAAB92